MTRERIGREPDVATTTSDCVPCRAIRAIRRSASTPTTLVCGSNREIRVPRRPGPHPFEPRGGEMAVLTAEETPPSTLPHAAAKVHRSPLRAPAISVHGIVHHHEGAVPLENPGRLRDRGPDVRQVM